MGLDSHCAPGGSYSTGNHASPLAPRLRLPRLAGDVVPDRAAEAEGAGVCGGGRGRRASARHRTFTPPPRQHPPALSYTSHARMTQLQYESQGPQPDWRLTIAWVVCGAVGALTGAYMGLWLVFYGRPS